MARKSGVSWKGGRDMGALRMKIHERGEDFKARSLEALEASIAEGGMYVQDNLEAAVTKTGERRAERGGLPGRHDSGNMVGSTSYEVRNPRARIVTGVFGWWGSNFEAYFRDQDLGEGNIPAARALPNAFFRARENFRRRMRDVARGKRGDSR